MSKTVSEASEDFEFIDTPAAPTPAPIAEDYSVRITNVSSIYFHLQVQSPTPTK